METNVPPQMPTSSFGLCLSIYFLARLTLNVCGQWVQKSQETERRGLGRNEGLGSSCCRQPVEIRVAEIR